jgi:hypothetical protein
MSNARRKLNAGFATGSLLLATVIGAAGQSWTVFGAALVAMLAVHVIGGDIRPTRGRR